jgi:hypothetical protein
MICSPISNFWSALIELRLISMPYAARLNSAAARGETDEQYQAALAAMMGIAPRDESEGMLAAQMVATHSAAMECYRRSMLDNQTFEGRRENLNQANKLVRSFATLMEALNRHRGKGQQRVTVEHVHVHEGGQAIVGNVTPGGGASSGGTTRCSRQRNASMMAAAIKPNVASQLTAPINRSVMRQCPPLSATAPHARDGAEGASVKKRTPPSPAGALTDLQIVETVSFGFVVERQLGLRSDLFQNAPKPLNLLRMREWMTLDGAHN